MPVCQTFTLDSSRRHFVFYDVIWLLLLLKWYYDQKTFFSFGFETLFTKHYSSEILGLNSVRRRHFIYTTIFRFNGPPLSHEKGYKTVFVPSARRAQGTMLSCTRVCP